MPWLKACQVPHLLINRLSSPKYRREQHIQSCSYGHRYRWWSTSTSEEARVDKPDLQATQVKELSPHLFEIESLKEQHIAQISKLKDEHEAKIEMLKAEDQEIQHMEEVNELNEKHQVEIKSLKQENEELKHIAQAQKTETRTQEHLVQVGAAVRRRWFELAKNSLVPASLWLLSLSKEKEQSPEETFVLT